MEESATRPSHANLPEENWGIFLSDLDLGLETQMGEALLAQFSEKAPGGSSQRLKAKNRRAQQRYRDRTKVKYNLKHAPGYS